MTLVQGSWLQEPVGPLCHRCFPVGNSMPEGLDHVIEHKDEDGISGRLDEAANRSAGILPAFADNESVDRHDKLYFQGGRNVILLTANELRELGGRPQGYLPQYVTQGIPVITMRKENNASETEDVYVFPRSRQTWPSRSIWTKPRG